MDTTDGSSQPFVDERSGHALVFNGAIYNYPELRKELEGRGHVFRSHGDTEVVLRAFLEYGPACVERFNGMFAFAIHDANTGRLFLARDRLGIKPLYLVEGEGRLRFASNPQALLAAGEVDTSVDPIALHHYLSFHAVVPAPHTIYRGIRKLPPATTWIIERDGTRTENVYWDLTYPEAGSSSAEELRERLHHELRNAVDRRMVADVPVGVLLSGGLDSSLIVGLLAEAGVKDLKTFSIGFESVDDEEGDEFRYSDVIARHFATDHHRIQVSGFELLETMDRVFDAMNEPMVSHDNVGFFLLSQEVSKHVKVVQSGQGADEVFAGYHWYPPLLDASPTEAARTYKRAFLDRDHREMSEVLEATWLGDDHSGQFIDEAFRRRGATHAIDQGLRLDTTVMLTDDPVKRVDSHTMAFGLEARVPFLDHELVEFAATIPGALKTAQEGKGILKDVGRDVIPSEVIDRPKGYFPVPQLKYLRGDVLDRVRDIVTSQRFRERGLFRPTYVNMLLDAPEEHITPLRGSKLWQIASLGWWLDVHERSPARS